MQLCTHTHTHALTKHIGTHTLTFTPTPTPPSTPPPPLHPRRTPPNQKVLCPNVPSVPSASCSCVSWHRPPQHGTVHARTHTWAPKQTYTHTQFQTHTHPPIHSRFTPTHSKVLYPNVPSAPSASCLCASWHRPPQGTVHTGEAPAIKGQARDTSTVLITRIDMCAQVCTCQCVCLYVCVCVCVCMCVCVSYGQRTHSRGY